MDTAPDPASTSGSDRAADGNGTSNKTWAAFLYRNWKWIAALMVLGLIIDAFDGKEADHSEAKTTMPSSEVASGRTLPKVQRAAWGPKTLSDTQRYVLVDDPAACKGKEYKMEVKYKGGGTRDKNGNLEDIECDVWTGGNFFQMEFSFPADLKQPAVKPGDYLVLSFVFSGATRSLFSQPNVVTAIERPRH
jgi:hypothetical protein